MPNCSICSLSNLYSDTLVFSVYEDVDKYRDKPTGLPRHRICRKCLESIEARDHFMFKILHEYPTKNKDQEPSNVYKQRTLRQKLLSKHYRVTEYRRKRAAEEFEIDLKIKKEDEEEEEPHNEQ